MSYEFYIFTFFYTFIFQNLQATIQYLESLFWGKQKGVEAAESGNNSISEENTEENEETEDSVGADDEKVVR